MAAMRLRHGGPTIKLVEKTGVVAEEIGFLSLDTVVRPTHKGVMKLHEYLSSHSIRKADFGAQIGRSRSVVSRLCSGKSMPSLKLMRAIEKATHGQVTMADFLCNNDNGLPPPPTEKAA